MKCSHRKRKWCKSAETYFKKLVKLHWVNWFCGGFYPFAPTVQRPVVTRHRHGVFHMYAIALVAWSELAPGAPRHSHPCALRTVGNFPKKYFIFDAHVICLFDVKAWHLPPFMIFFVNLWILMAHLGIAAAVSPLLSTHIGKFPPKVFDAFVRDLPPYMYIF